MHSKHVEILKMLEVLNSFNLGGSKDESKVEGLEMVLCLRTPSGMRMTLNVSASESIAMLKAKILDKRTHITYAGKKLANNDETLMKFGIQNGSTLEETGMLFGGAGKPLVKKAMKRDETISVMHKRFTKKLEEQHGVDGESSQVPEPIADLVRKIKTAMAEASEYHKSEGNAVEKAIGALKSHQMESLKEFLDTKVSGEAQDRRIQRLSYELWPKIATIDEMIGSMSKIKCEILGSAAEILLSEVGVPKGESLVINNDAVKTLFKVEQSFRAKMRLASKGEQAEVVEADAEAASSLMSGCAIA